MRKMMIGGGAAGFGIGILSGLVTEGSSWPTILLRASVGALVAGLLMRWWTGIYCECWYQVQKQHQQTQEKNSQSPLSALTK